MANELRKVAETFAEVPDGRGTVHALRMLAHLLDSGRRALTGTCPVGWAGRFPFRCLECVHGGARIRVKGPFSGRRARQNLKCVRPDLEARMRAAGHEGRRRGLVHDDWL